MVAPRSALLGLLATFASGLVIVVFRGPAPPRPPDGPPPPAAVEADVAAYYALPPGAARRLGSLDLRHTGAASLHFPADGATLVTAGSDGLRVWDLASHKLLRHYPPESFPGRPVVSTPDNRFFVAMGDEGVRVISREDGKLVRRIGDEGDELLCFAVSPDGRTVATGTAFGEVRFWELETGRSLPFRAIHPPAPTGPPDPPFIFQIAFSPDGAVVASAGSGEGIRGWDIRTGKAVWHLGPDAIGPCPFAFSPDGRLVAASIPRRGSEADELGRTGLALWRLADRAVAVELKGLPTAYRVAFSPDGRLVAAGGNDGALRIWDIRTGKLRLAIPVTPAVWAVAFSRDGRRLAAVVDDDRVGLWDAQTGAVLLGEGGHTGEIVALAAAADGRTAFTAGKEGTVRAWDTATGRPRWVAQLSLPVGWVSDLVLSPDGTAVVVRAGDRVRVHNAATGRELWRSADSVSVDRVAYSPDGTTLAALGLHMTVHLWDAATGRSRGKLVGYDGLGCRAGGSLRFAPDGNTLVAPAGRGPGAGGRDNGFDPDLGPIPGPDERWGLVVWDVRTGRRLEVIAGDDEYRRHEAAPLPGGKQGVVQDGKEVLVIDLRTGAVERRFPVADGGLVVAPNGRVWVGGDCYAPATGVKVGGVAAGERCLPAISADGRVLVTASDNTALVWPLPPR